MLVKRVVKTKPWTVTKELKFRENKLCELVSLPIPALWTVDEMMPCACPSGLPEPSAPMGHYGINVASAINNSEATTK